MKLSYYIDFYNDTYTDSNVAAIRIKNPGDFILTLFNAIDIDGMPILAPYMDVEVDRVKFIHEENGIIMQVVLKQ